MGTAAAENISTRLHSSVFHDWSSGLTALLVFLSKHLTGTFIMPSVPDECDHLPERIGGKKKRKAAAHLCPPDQKCYEDKGL